MAQKKRLMNICNFLSILSRMRLALLRQGCLHMWLQLQQPEILAKMELSKNPKKKNWRCKKSKHTACFFLLTNLFSDCVIDYNNLVGFIYHSFVMCYNHNNGFLF